MFLPRFSSLTKVRVFFHPLLVCIILLCLPRFLCVIVLLFLLSSPWPAPSLPSPLKPLLHAGAPRRVRSFPTANLFSYLCFRLASSDCVYFARNSRAYVLLAPVPSPYSPCP